MWIYQMLVSDRDDGNPQKIRNRVRYTSVNIATSATLCAQLPHPSNPTTTPTQELVVVEQPILETWDVEVWDKRVKVIRSASPSP
jgi:hypothetical protein